MELVREAGRQLLGAVSDLLPLPVPEPEPQGPGRVLTVGDGDLSFSRELLREANRVSHQRLELVATTWDSREELLRCYGESIAETINELEQHGNCQASPRVRSRCLHSVDATALAETLQDTAELQFNRIDWLFPHTGQKKIQTNRALLRRFFVSARSQLCSGGVVRVALCAGQGGTPLESPRRRYGDSWHVVEQAACAGLVLTSVVSFDEELRALPGYRSTGHRKTARGFHTEGALMHVFAEPATRGGRSNSIYPPAYEHCITFWWPIVNLASGADVEIGTSLPLSQWLLRVLYDVAGEHCIESCVLVERWDPPVAAGEGACATTQAPPAAAGAQVLDPKPGPVAVSESKSKLKSEPEQEMETPKVKFKFMPGHTSLSYRVTYRSRTTALSRTKAASLQADVRIQLGLMGVAIR